MKENVTLMKEDATVKSKTEQQIAKTNDENSKMRENIKSVKVVNIYLCAQLRSEETSLADAQAHDTSQEVKHMLDRH